MSWIDPEVRSTIFWDFILTYVLKPGIEFAGLNCLERRSYLTLIYRQTNDRHRKRFGKLHGATTFAYCIATTRRAEPFSPMDARIGQCDSLAACFGVGTKVEVAIARLQEVQRQREALRVAENRLQDALVGLSADEAVAVGNACNATPNRPICSGCNCPIDPDCCHCGLESYNHAGETHSFVPMGCMCHRCKCKFFITPDLQCPLHGLIRG